MSEVGQQVGRYALLERIAVGGMAELYRAQMAGPSGFAKTVAIKRILPELSHRVRFREMFLHEGRLMGQLAHRNLVQVFELGEEDGELYLALEYVPGCDLARVLQHLRSAGQRMEPALAAWIARELCHGLDYVHTVVDERGQPLHIVHRDVNPQNILLSRQGDVKLADFGIARSMDHDELRTQRGHIKGKLQYLSPEQARGDSLGPASDLYSLGLCLFEMLTGQRYIQGQQEAELLARAAHPVARSVSVLAPGVPRSLERIVERLLRAEPDTRFGSALPVARSLGEYLASCGKTPDATSVAALVEACVDTSAQEPLAPTLVASRDDFDPTHRATRLLAPARRPDGTLELAAAHPRSILHRDRPWFGRGARLGLGALLLGLGAVLWWRPARDPAARVAERGTIVDAALVVASVHRDAGPAEDRSVSTDERSGEDSDWDLSPEIVDAGPGGQASLEIRRAGRRRPPRTRPGNAVQAGSPRAESRGPGLVTTGTDLRTLRHELERQDGRLRERGVRQADSAQVDGLRDRAARALQQRDPASAQAALAQLDRAVDGLVIDRAFVERKVLRLQRRLAKAGREAEFEAQRREILEHAVRNRFVEANAALNRVLDAL